MTTDNSERSNSGRFAKGHSGNSKGRPRKAPRAFLPMQHEIDFLEAMEKAVPVTGPDGQRIMRPAVLILMDRAVMEAIKHPDPKVVMALLDRYLKVLEKNRLSYLDEEKNIKILEAEITQASGEKLSDLKRLLSHFKWKTRRH